MNEERLSEERELYLYYVVFGNPMAQELIDFWINELLNTAHFQPTVDPNNIKTIRDMAVLEFIQGIKNRVKDFYEKGVKNGTIKPVDQSIDTDNAVNSGDRRGTDTGNPSL